MPAIIMLAALIAAAPPETSTPGPELAVIEEKEVAFEALADGNAERAVAELEARLLQEPEDPAVLINLGAAYARLGRPERAAAAFRAAMDSNTRYNLELADGRWLDSRRAARLALANLGSGTALAQR